MFLDALEQYQDIISSYDVYNLEWLAYQLIAKVYLSNQTELHVKDYLFLDGTRKYSYHWQETFKETALSVGTMRHIIKQSQLFLFINISVNRKQ